MAIARVQGNTGNANPALSASVTISAVGSGNCIVGWIMHGGGITSITSVTDNKGNTYNIKDNLLDGTSVDGACSFILGNITNGPTTITASGPGSNDDINIMVTEYSGVALLSDPSDGHNMTLTANPGTTTNAITSGSITPTTDGCLIWGATTDLNGTPLPTNGTGFTLREQNSVDSPMATEDLTQATAASIAATFTATTSASARWYTAVIAIKPKVANLVAPLLPLGRQIAPVALRVAKPFLPQGTVASGPNLFNQTVTIASTSALALSKQVGKILSIASTTALALIKQAGKTASIASTTALASVRSVGKILPIASTTALVATASRAFLRTLTIASTTALAVVKSVGKITPIASTTAVALGAKAITRQLSIASTTALATIKQVGKSLSIASVTALTATAIRVILKTLSIASTTAVASVRAVSKPSLAIASTTALTAIKSVGKTLSIASVTALVVGAIKVKIVNVSIACTTALAKGVQAIKPISIASTTALNSARAVTKSLAISCTTALNRVRSVGKVLAIASVTALTESGIKAKNVILTITSTTGLALTRAVTKTLPIASVTAIAKQFVTGKKLFIASSTALSLLTTRLRQIVLSIAAHTAVAMSRSFVKVLVISVTTTLSSIKQIATTVGIACRTAVVRTALSSVTAVAAYARTIIGRATLLNIIGRADPITIVASRPAAQVIGTPMPTVHDPEDFVCGDNWQLTGPLQDASGNPLNLTGATVSWKLDSLDGTTNIISLSTGSGISVVNSLTATILVNVPAATTRTVAPGSYRDWLRVTLGDGTVLTEWTGIIRATGNPT